MSGITDDDVFVHEAALCDTEDIGAGTRIWAFAHLMAGSKVGTDCNIGGHAFLESGAVIGNGVVLKNNVSVWDGVVLEDDVFVGPSVTFTNDPLPRANPAFKRTSDLFVGTLVQRGASLGANATIVCGVTIGRHAVVGAGSVVTRDVSAHALVFGVPARFEGWVCVCGRRLPSGLRCPCGRSYAKLDRPNGLRLISDDH